MRRNSVLLMCILVIISMLSGIAYGADAVVEYRTDAEGNHIGIESITLDPYTYYDASDLLGEDKELTLDKLEVVAGQLFHDWGPIATEIFRKNPEVAFHNTGSFDDYFGTNVSESGGKTDLRAYFSGNKSQDAYFHGEKSHDCVITSGLNYATKLDDIVVHMSEQIADGLGNRYNTDDQTMYDKHDLKAVKEAEETKAYYRIATSIDNNGSTYGYYYNCYALALYDFELAPVVAPGITVPNAVVTQDSTSATPTVSNRSYFENRTNNASTVSANLSSTTSETVSNTVTSTKSISFTETVGVEAEISEFLGYENLKTKFSFSFSANQALSTSKSDSKSISNSYTNGTSVSLSLPPYTSVVMQEEVGRSSATIAYDCPVVLRYKVAVFSMSGFRYDDRALTDYWKNTKDFVTFFGTGTEEGGFGAPENLYLRAIKNKNKLERAYGQVKGNHNNRTAITVLDWDQLGAAEENIRHAATRIPLFSSGASMTLTKETRTTELAEIMPLFPLNFIKVSAPKASFVGSQEYSYGGYNYLKATMKVGETSYTDYFDLSAKNRYSGEYYGFMRGKGHWIVADINGKELKETEAPVKLERLGVSGSQRFTAVRPGTCFLKYIINEDVYATADQPQKYTKNSDLTRTAAIEITVSDIPKVPEESIAVHGSFSGYVDEEPVSIEGASKLSVSITNNDTGKELEKDYVWEQKELPAKGMLLSGKNVSFTQTGTFHVRAVSGDLISPWVTVTAKERTYQVTYDPKNGKAAGTLTVKKGDTVTLPQPDPMECKAFTGWYTDAACKTSYDATQPVTKNLKLYGGWADSHKLKKTKAKAAGCLKDGHVEYYTCRTCKKLFLDADAKEETTLAETVIEATGHDWGEWQVTREATAAREGIETRVCKHKASHKEKRTIPKVVQKVDTDQFMIAYVASTGRNYIRIRWTKLKDAKRYVIYAGECGDSLEKLCTLNAINGVKKIRKIDGEKIEEDRYYKFYVVAYGRNENGKMVRIGRTPVIHSATGTRLEFRNYDKVVLKTSKSMQLSVGGTGTVNAGQYRTAPGLAQKHTKVRYLSTDPSVAKVGMKSGRVTAKAAGTCRIYCIGQNGEHEVVKVTVR